MTAAELLRLDEVISMGLRHWSGHPDLDDMAQEARIKAWKAITKSRNEGHPLNIATVGSRCASYAGIQFLRSPGALRRWNRWTKTAVESVSLDGMQAEASEQDEPDLDKRNVLPSEADFAGELVERLDREAFCLRLLSGLAAPARAVLVHYYWDGWTLKEIGKELGVSESRAHQLLRAGLARGR